jgi:putative addiction module component (TIGR02574 family)
MGIAAPKWTSPEAEAVLRQVRKLPEQDQLRMVEQVVDDLRADAPTSLSEEWEEEIAQRIEAYERGELKTIDAEEVFARAEAKYGR